MNNTTLIDQQAELRMKQHRAIAAADFYGKAADSLQVTIEREQQADSMFAGLKDLVEGEELVAPDTVDVEEDETESREYVMTTVQGDYDPDATVDEILNIEPLEGDTPSPQTTAPLAAG